MVCQRDHRAADEITLMRVHKGEDGAAVGAVLGGRRASERRFTDGEPEVIGRGLLRGTQYDRSLPPCTPGAGGGLREPEGSGDG